MKKLFILAATLIPLVAVMVGVRLLGQPMREVSEVRAAIERKDFESVRPFVRVTGRVAAWDLTLDWSSSVQIPGRSHIPAVRGGEDPPDCPIQSSNRQLDRTNRSGTAPEVNPERIGRINSGIDS